MRKDQFDLFDGPTTSCPCEVIPFPAARLFGKARRLVNQHERLKPAAFDSAWDRMLDEIEDDLIVAGVSESDRAQHLQLFADLCDAERWKRIYGRSDAPMTGDPA